MKFKAIICTSHGEFALRKASDGENSFQLIGGREFICDATNIIEAENFFTELFANDFLWNACILNDGNCKIKVVTA